MHGVCLGGGFELALACDYIVAAGSAKIGSVEVALGLHPLLGGIQRQVQRAGAMRAKEIAMLGRRYDATTLERWGLVNLVVADDDALEEVTMTIAEEFAHGPTVAHAATSASFTLPSMTEFSPPTRRTRAAGFWIPADKTRFVSEHAGHTEHAYTRANAEGHIS